MYLMFPEIIALHQRDQMSKVETGKIVLNTNMMLFQMRYLFLESISIFRKLFKLLRLKELL